MSLGVGVEERMGLSEGYELLGVFMLHGGFLQSYVIGIESQFTWLGAQCSSN